MTRERNIYIPLARRKSMKKIIFAFAFLIIFLFATIVNAAPYYMYNYGGNNFDSYTFHSSHASGYNGFVSQRDTFFNKETSSRYLRDGTYEKRTTFTTTTHESPPWQPYNSYVPNYNYANYNRYNYYDDRYWYQKYWNPKNAYNYNSYPQYSYNYGYNY